MRRVPRFCGGVVTQSLAIVMTDHRRARGAARPIAAGPVLIGRERPAIGLRTGQYVMIIRRIASAGDYSAALGQRGVHVHFVVVAMEIVDALRDGFSLKVLPGAASDAVAAVAGRRAIHGLGAEIGAPGFAACARILCQSLALPVRAFQSAEIGTFAEPGTGDKEGHVG